MDILIADDEPISLTMLDRTLCKWGHRVTAVATGTAAWDVLQRPHPPRLVILDWMMPGMDGPEVCRQFRATAEGQAAYIILLTARGDTSDLVAGLDSGADDYITKPFHTDELRARVRVGMRIASLQQSLAERVADLEEALGQVTQLQGLLPICCYCKRIRDDGNYWHQVESYFAKRSSAQFSHGICPACFEEMMKHNREPAAS